MCIDYDAHKNLASPPTAVEAAIQKANALADKGDYLVCKINKGHLVLHDFSARVRKEATLIYSPRTGYEAA